jgi:capsular exopolysaccharide synthesis family protein
MVKSHPRTKLVFAFGGLMGWLAGLGIAFFRHNTDRSISNPVQIREELGLECLASIPCLPSYDHRSALLRAIPQSGITNKALRWLEEYFPLQIQAAPGDPYKNGTPHPLDTVAALPFSSFSYGIKKLKAAISIAGRARQLRCIGITSALPGEGKTTIAANLAALFAVSGIRTLLIDGDLLNSSLSRSLAPASEVGLLEAIGGEAELQNCIVRPENANFDLLPVADIHQGPCSDSLLGSEKARRLMEGLKNEYEFIIVEMPPLVANLDALTMGSMLDATLLLVQSGRTPMPVILESAYLLRNARLDTLGVALNMVEPSMVNYGDAPGNYRPYY